MVDYDNPWLFKGSPFLSENIDDLYGFVYCITNTDNDKKYIGRKYFWQYRKLEVRLGELEVKAIGKNTTEVLKNLMKNAVGLEIVPSEERYYPSTRVRDESILKKPDNFSYTLF